MPNFTGTSGDDYWIGTDDGETANGGAGNDSMYARAGDDIVNGDDGNDEIDGHEGNDQLNGGAGNDIINGDDGLTFLAQAGNDIINGGSGDDQLFGDEGNDTIDGGADRDFIFGGEGADIADGGDGDDYIAGFEYGSYFDLFADTLRGGDGDDRISVNFGDSVDGGIGTDTIFLSFYQGSTGGITADFRNLASNGTVTIGGATVTNIEFVGSISLTPFDDVVVAGAFLAVGSDRLYISGYEGNDDLTGSLGVDVIEGGDGNDIIRGGVGLATEYSPSQDRLYGGAGDDTFYVGLDGAFVSGGTGNDIAYGGDARDDLRGDDGDDRLFGGGNDDGIEGGYGQDQIDGGTGADYLNGMVGNDQIDGGSGNDDIYGGADSDLVHGGDGHDIIHGGDWNFGDGSDILYGDGGDDILNGALGGDGIDGGEGNDVIFSNAGSPYFYLLTTTDAIYGNFVGVGDYSADVDTLSGGAGDDVLVAGFGDAVDGGFGNDTLFLALDGATAGVTADFRQLDNGGSLNIAGQLMQGIETVALVDGSDYDDVLTGSDSGAFGTRLYGYAGNDQLIAGAMTSEIVGGTGDDILDGRSSTLNTYLAGLQGNDTIYAGAGATAYGGSGNDIVTGSAGVETLYGDSGADILTGGLGIDSLGGGTDSDIFRDTSAGLNGDTITDLTSGDTIVLTDATLAGFSFSLTGSTLTYSGGSLTLTGFTGTLTASAAAGGGVQLSAGAAATIADVRNDFNGDGRSDILWRNVDGQMSNWLGQANGGFVQNNANAAAVVPMAWAIAGTGDFNGDGRDDILWRNVDGQMSNWLATASGGYIQNNANAAAVVPTAWQVAGTGDFNGDGRDDILWRNTNGTVSDWLGTASGGFIANDANAARFVPTSWSVVGTGDFNGDGRDDILWRNTNGTVTDWLANANGSFTPNDAAAAQVVPTAWHVQPEEPFI